MKVNLDLETISGGPVDMNKTVGFLVSWLSAIDWEKQTDLQQIEHLIVRLLTQEYLQEEYHETAYCRVVYLAPGPLAARLSHHTRQSIKGEVKRKLEFLFPASEIKSGTKRKNAGSNQPSGSKKRKSSANKSSKVKGKSKAVEPDDQDDFGDEEPDNVLPEVEDISFLSDDEAPSQQILHKYVPDNDDYGSINLDLSDDNDDSTNNFTWSHSLLEEPRPRFKPYLKKQTKASNRSTMNIVQECDNAVITLSSD